MAPRLEAISVLFLLACSGLFLLACSVDAAEDAVKLVMGRVVDEAGRPVPGASVSAVWGANGLDWDRVVAVRDAEPEKLWQDEGKMEPWGNARVVTDAAGRFSIPAPERKNSLLVYDHERRHGAVIVFDPSAPGSPSRLVCGR
jgi:hypothetical protein